MKVAIQEVRAGDWLKVAGEGVARVRCVVRIARDTSKPLIALPGGLRITPRHPVLIGGHWQLPCDVTGATSVANEFGYVYNLVLDRCHLVPVDGVECATWGHGFQGDVIEHAFFGTQRVVDNLATLKGWKTGFVEIGGAFRDQDGKVVALWSHDNPALSQDVPCEECPGSKVAGAEISALSDIWGLGKHSHNELHLCSQATS